MKTESLSGVLILVVVDDGLVPIKAVWDDFDIRLS